MPLSISVKGSIFSKSDIDSETVVSGDIFSENKSLFILETFPQNDSGYLAGETSERLPMRIRRLRFCGAPYSLASNILTGFCTL